jgi:hypothetical protein
MLTVSQMQSLFPDDGLSRERYGGRTMSVIAYNV